MNVESRKAEISEVLTSETKLGILFSLQFFESLNLKQIAEIVGIKEPSAFEHIKGRGKKIDERGLLDLGLIEEDWSQKSRGKYYKLTKLAMEFFLSIDAGIKNKGISNESGNEVSEFFNLEKKKNLKIITRFFRNIAVLAKNFAIYTANIIDEKISESGRKIEKNLEDEIYINFSYLNIKTNEQKKKLNDIFAQFGKAIHELAEESKESTETILEEKFFVYTFSTSINFIDPRNR